MKQETEVKAYLPCRLLGHKLPSSESASGAPMLRKSRVYEVTGLTLADLHTYCARCGRDFYVGTVQLPSCSGDHQK